MGQARAMLHAGHRGGAAQGSECPRDAHHPRRVRRPSPSLSPTPSSVGGRSGHGSASGKRARAIEDRCPRTWRSCASHARYRNAPDAHWPASCARSGEVRTQHWRGIVHHDDPNEPPAAPLPSDIRFRTPETRPCSVLNPAFACDSGVLSSHVLHTGAHRPHGTAWTVAKRLRACQAATAAARWPACAGRGHFGTHCPRAFLRSGGARHPWPHPDDWTASQGGRAGGEAGNPRRHAGTPFRYRRGRDRKARCRPRDPNVQVREKVDNRTRRHPGMECKIVIRH